MRRSPLMLTLILTALAMGCGAPSDPLAGRIPVYPVEGKLLIEGRPVPNAQVVFHPLAHGEGPSLYPVGITRPDGTFSLMTYAAADGAPEGEYAVTLIWLNGLPFDECTCPDYATHDHFRGFYTDPAKTVLRATVRPGENRITLQATVSNAGWNLPRAKEPVNELSGR